MWTNRLTYNFVAARRGRVRLRAMGLERQRISRWERVRVVCFWNMSFFTHNPLFYFILWRKKKERHRENCLIKCTRHFIIQFAGFFLKPPQSSLFFAVNVKNIIPRLSDYGISKAPFPVLSDYRKSKESFPALSEDGMLRISFPALSEDGISKTLFPVCRITEYQKHLSPLCRITECQKHYSPFVGLRNIKSIFPRFVGLRKVKNIIPRFIGRRNVKNIIPRFVRRRNIESIISQCVELRDVIHHIYPIFLKGVIPSVSGREMSLINYFKWSVLKEGPHELTFYHVSSGKS